MHYGELKTAWNELTAPGAPFEIIRIPVLGQELRAYKNAPPTIRHFWLSTAAYGERTYLVYGDERITYAEAHARVAAIANWILDAGVKPGDRVAIAMRNYPEWMLIYWACACIGVAAVGMNAWWVPEEMAYAFKDSAPKIIFCDPERLERIIERPEIAGDAKVIVTRAKAVPAGMTDYADVLARGGSLPDITVDPDADACIFYTSGTTGNPKGAQLTHR